MRKTFGAAALAAAVSGVAGMATAADLNAVGSLKDAYVAQPLWGGWYYGLNGGYAWGTEVNQNGTLCHNAGPCVSNAGSAAGDGGFGGGQIGFNIQRDRLVFGLEADIQGAGVTASAATAGAGLASASLIGPGIIAASSKAESELDWFGTVRGRLGLTFPDAGGLLYVTGGFAFGEAQHKLSSTIYNGSTLLGSDSASNDAVETGWVLGAGYERFISPAMSLKVEYQFIDLSLAKSLQISGSYGSVSSTANATFVDDFSTVRLGLNYHAGAVYEPLK